MKAKIEAQPHERRRGWLKNGNPPGDFTKAPRCGAKNRRGTPLPGPGHEKRAVQVARREINRTPDPGGAGTYEAGQD